jgi:hypothetical protein
MLQPLPGKVGINSADKQRVLGQYSSPEDWKPRILFFFRFIIIIIIIIILLLLMRVRPVSAVNTKPKP